MNEVNLEKIWPGWRVVRTLGQGSYGVVYEAVHEEAGFSGRAAVKVISIPQNRAELDTLRSEGMTEEQSRTYLGDVVNEFISEIRLMYSLKGTENIVSVEDYRVIEKQDEVGWDIYIRMELLTPLVRYISDKTLDEREIIKLGIDLCSALEVCARKHVLHRDIKPENIFVNEFGSYKLGDFGIARTLENSSHGLSQKGTFNYMAPEVYRGNSYSANVDIYSLGLVLYYLSNNRKLPFLSADKSLHSHGERMEALQRRFSGEPLPPPCNASKALSDVILTACAPNPAIRFQTASSMKNALSSLPGAPFTYIDRPSPAAGTPLPVSGTPFPAVGTPQQLSGQQESFGPDVPSEKKKKKTGLIIGIAAAVLLLISGGAFFVIRALNSRTMEIPGMSEFAERTRTKQEDPDTSAMEEKTAGETASDAEGIEAPVTEEPSTEESSTEEPSAKETETEENSTEAPETAESSTEEPSTEEPASEDTEAAETEPEETEADEDLLDLAKLKPADSEGAGTLLEDYYSDGMNWRGAVTLHGDTDHDASAVYTLGSGYTKLHLVFACRRDGTFSEFDGNFSVLDGKTEAVIYTASLNPLDDAREISVDVTGVESIQVVYDPFGENTLMLKDFAAVKDPDQEIAKSALLEQPEKLEFGKQNAEPGRSSLLNTLKDEYISDGMNWKGAVTIHSDSYHTGYAVYYLGGTYTKLHMIYACNRESEYSELEGTIRVLDTKTNSPIYEAPIHPQDDAREINLDVTGVNGIRVEYEPRGGNTLMLKDFAAAKDSEEEVGRSNVLELPEEFVFAKEKAEIGRTRGAGTQMSSYESDGADWKGAVTLYGNSMDDGYAVYYLGSAYTLLHLSYVCNTDLEYNPNPGHLAVYDAEKDTELFRAEVSPSDSAKTVDVDISGVKSVKIQYEPYGSGTILIKDMTAVR